MQRGASTGCHYFFPPLGPPLLLSLLLKPSGDSPKENSKTGKRIKKKYGLNEKSERAGWFSAAKKMRNGAARAEHGSNLQIFESLQQRLNL